MIAKIVVIVSAYFLLPLASMLVLASEIYIYPSQGQSEDQMGQDKYECHNWASKQTGYDPTNISSSSAGISDAPQKPQQRGALRGALRGAAVGAVVGEITDEDAGKGAARGAAVGGLFGGMRQRSKKQRHEEELRRQLNEQQQSTSLQDSKLSDYKRAMAACLEARGYSVK